MLALISRSAFVLLMLLLVAPVACTNDHAATREESENDWSVTLDATGGELGKDTSTIEITSKNGEIKASTTDVVVGQSTKREAITTHARCDKMWREVEALGAWKLGDVDHPVEELPNYTVKLHHGDQSKTISVRGARISDPQLRVVHAIQECVTRAG